MFLSISQHSPFRIGTSDEGRALGKGFYLKDKEPMRKLMHGICDNILPSTDFITSEKWFKEQFRTRPVVPGDLPYWKEEWQDNAEVKPDAETTKAIPEQSIALPSVPEATTNAVQPVQPVTEDSRGVLHTPEKAVSHTPAKDVSHTPEEKIEDDADNTDSANETQPSRHWLYIGIGVFLCLAGALYLIRKNKF